MSAASCAILSNLFEEQCTQNHPQYLSGLSRVLFPTTFLEIGVWFNNAIVTCTMVKKHSNLSYGKPLVSRQPSRSAESKIISQTDSFTIHYK